MDLFAKAIDDNVNIDSSEIKEIMKESLSSIQSYFEENDYLKYVDLDAVLKRLQDVKVEAFSEEDKKQRPNSVGLYFVDENTIKLKELSFSNDLKHALKHEILHLFSSGDVFCSFINEGMTEYLTREIDKHTSNKSKVKYTYHQNVGFAEYLHNILGDDMVKAYIRGDARSLDEKLSSMLTYDGQSDIMTLIEFNELLDNVQNFLHPHIIIDSKKKKKDIKNKAKGIEKNEYRKLIVFARNILINSYGIKAKNHEFDKDGKVDLDLFTRKFEENYNKLIGILKDNNTFGINNYEDLSDFKKDIFASSLQFVVEESGIEFNEEISDISYYKELLSEKNATSKEISLKSIKEAIDERKTAVSKSSEIIN